MAEMRENNQPGFYLRFKRSAESRSMTPSFQLVKTNHVKSINAHTIKCEKT